MKNHITPVCNLALLTILLTACTMKPVHVEPQFPKGPVAIRLESPSISIGDTIVLHEMDLDIHNRILNTTSFTADNQDLALLFHIPTGLARYLITYKGQQLELFAESLQYLYIKFDTPEDLPYATPTGGFYDNPRVSDYISRENQYRRKSKANTDRMTFFAAIGNNDSLQYYINRQDSIQKNSRPDEVAFFKLTDNQLSVYNFAHYWGNDRINKKYFIKQWNRLSQEMKESGAGPYYQRIMESRASLKSGAPAPDFSLTDEQGDTLSKAGLSGRFVMLYHWGFCGYVMLNVPDLKKLKEKYADQLDVILLSESDTWNSVRNVNPQDAVMSQFGELTGDQFIHVESDKYGNAQVLKDYLFTSTPNVALISPDGKMLTYGLGDALNAADVIISVYNKLNK